MSAEAPTTTSWRWLGWLIGLWCMLLQLVPFVLRSWVSDGIMPRHTAMFLGRPLPAIVVDLLAGRAGSGVAVHRIWWGALVVDALVVAAVVWGGRWFFARRRRWRANLLAVVGGMGLTVLLVVGQLAALSPALGQLRRERQTEFVRRSIEELQAQILDSEWLASELARARPVDGKRDGVGRHVIVAEDGAWILYRQECSKSDPTCGDVFVGCGADGRWFYSTSHYCVDMLVAHWYAPYPDLAAFVNAEKVIKVETFGNADSLLVAACE